MSKETIHSLKPSDADVTKFAVRGSDVHLHLRREQSTCWGNHVYLRPQEVKACLALKDGDTLGAFGDCDIESVRRDCDGFSLYVKPAKRVGSFVGARITLAEMQAFAEALAPAHPDISEVLIKANDADLSGLYHGGDSLRAWFKLFDGRNAFVSFTLDDLKRLRRASFLAPRTGFSDRRINDAGQTEDGKGFYFTVKGVEFPSMPVMNIFNLATSEIDAAIAALSPVQTATANEAWGAAWDAAAKLQAQKDRLEAQYQGTIDGLTTALEEARQVSSLNLSALTATQQELARKTEELNSAKDYQGVAYNKGVRRGEANCAGRAAASLTRKQRSVISREYLAEELACTRNELNTEPNLYLPSDSRTARLLKVTLIEALLAIPSAE